MAIVMIFYLLIAITFGLDRNLFQDLPLLMMTSSLILFEVKTKAIVTAERRPIPNLKQRKSLMAVRRYSNFIL